MMRYLTHYRLQQLQLLRQLVPAIKQHYKTGLLYGSFVAVGLFAILALITFLSLKPVPEDLSVVANNVVKRHHLDRYGKPLNVTYANDWNVYDQLQLHDIPEFLQHAFLMAEDKRFYRHGGIDWYARFNALRQNIFAGKKVRGASTISEQVVKMLHPRPRSAWSRWLEGFEAKRLERKHSKAAILEFYLNQVPYQARRRGIKQAAAYYFDRDISTLSKKEMLALAVFIRAPNRLDPVKHKRRVEHAINDLAERMQRDNIAEDNIEENNTVEQTDIAELNQQPLAIKRPSAAINASHFIEYLNQTEIPSLLISSGNDIHTTLDSELQSKIQRTLDTRLQALKKHNVNNGAVLVVDHFSNEILAWVVAFAGDQQHPHNKMNPVLAGRQPGSSLKPFLYAKALDKGWTAATLIDDSPLEEGVGLGMHRYHNYSRGYYGPVSLRESLGNSLNIPAVRTIQFVGTGELLTFLRDIGVNSLDAHPNVYGDGIALGNGELTLLELVQAYTVLARMGSFKPLSVIQGEYKLQREYQALNEDVASLIADILSDPAAREKEFGRDSILNLPFQTAVKTGTSSDYRDAWAMGFNDRYTVGVWMGNLDYTEMHEVSGTVGPAVVLRTVFNELNRNRGVREIYRSTRLEKHRVCVDSGSFVDSLFVDKLVADELSSENPCETKDEWFISGVYSKQHDAKEQVVRLKKPTPNLQLAMDPRIPDRFEYFEFEISDPGNLSKVQWYINDQPVGTTAKNKFQWQLKRGQYFAKAKVWLQGDNGQFETVPVAFTVF